MFQHKNRIYPIEVKAGKTGTLKSLQVYLAEKRLDFGIRFNLDNPSFGTFNTNIRLKELTNELDWALLSLPLYFVSEIKRILDSINN